MTAPNPTLVSQRLTFGPKFGEALVPSDTVAWIDAQLSVAPVDPPNVQADLSAVLLAFTGTDAAGAALPAQMLPLTTLGASQASLWAAMKSAGSNFASQIRPAQEVQAASYMRATSSPNQLFELMVDFWHNHFNVYSQSSGTIAASYPVYDQIIRANAFGNFQSLLTAVGQSVPMMYYLNQVQSTGTHPNENYAREVMELHTLGAARYLGLTTPAGAAGTGYSDDDVIQGALILSGWTINQDDGSFVFKPSIHAGGSKTFLGRTIASSGKAEGDVLFSILATHSGTAQTIATKLYKRFVGDAAPPNSPVIAAMSQTFLANAASPTQISATLRTLLLSPEFAASSGAKFKTPFEFIVSLLRAVNVTYSPSASLNAMLTKTGDPRYGWVPPNGRPDVSPPWMGNGSLLQRLNAAEDLLSASTGILQDQWDGLFGAALGSPASIGVSLTNASQAVSRILTAVMPAGVSGATATALTQYAASPKVLGTQSTFRDAKSLRAALGLLIAAVAATPEFQFRG